MTRTSRYSPEVREQAVRMVLEQEVWIQVPMVGDRRSCRETPLSLEKQSSRSLQESALLQGRDEGRSRSSSESYNLSTLERLISAML